MSTCCPGTDTTQCAGPNCNYVIPGAKTVGMCSTIDPTPEHLLATYAKLTGSAMMEATPDTLRRAKAAFLKNVEWPQNATIKIGFYKSPVAPQPNAPVVDPQYTSDKAAWVQQVVMKYIKPLVNLSFQWDVDVSNADVRITFIKEAGAYSFIGTQAIDPSVHGYPSMNLGWLDQNASNSDFDAAVGTGAVVIHEFGHCLGMLHEHSRADATFTWNKPLVYSFLGCQPNCWSHDMVDAQVFNAITADQYNGSAYDVDSIMHYYFPPQFFSPPFNIPHATQLSDLDKEWINKMYGGGGKGIGGGGGSNTSTHHRTLMFVLIGLAILAVLIGLFLFFHHRGRHSYALRV